MKMTEGGPERIVLSSKMLTILQITFLKRLTTHIVKFNKDDLGSLLVSHSSPCVTHVI